MSEIICAVALSVALLVGSCLESSNDNPGYQQLESFETFYKKFKDSNQFRLQRTIFPIKVTISDGDGPPPGVTPDIIQIWDMADVVSDKKKLYVQTQIVENEGYSHSIANQANDVVEVKVGPVNSVAAVGYKFKSIKNQWFLIEHMDYWGY
jgi:hypothetical protein